MPGRLLLEMTCHPSMLTGKALCHDVPENCVTVQLRPCYILLLHVHPCRLLLVSPCAKQSWGCSADPWPARHRELVPVKQPELQAALLGTSAELQRQLAEGQPDKRSPATCRAGPDGAADRAAAEVHFASEAAGVPANRTAAPHGQLHGPALRSSIAGREANAGSANSSRLASPEPGQQPSQQHISSNDGRLAAGLEAGMFTEQSGSIEREPMQPLAGSAAGGASTAVPSPRGEAWTLGRATVPRRLPPLTISRQGTAGPSSQPSGDWVSCFCAACTGSLVLAASFCKWSGLVCRWLSQRRICSLLQSNQAAHVGPDDVCAASTNCRGKSCCLHASPHLQPCLTSLCC